MKRRRVVLVMTEPPLPFGNAAARWYYVLLKGLVERGHQVTALAAASQQEDVVAAADLFPAKHYDLRCCRHFSRRGIAGKWQSLRCPHSYLFAPELRRDLKRELSTGIDVLHLEHNWSGWLGPDATSPSILAVHYLVQIDLAEMPASSIGDRLRNMAICRAERRLLQRYRTIATVTPALAARVREIAPNATVHTVPLAFDISLYPFEPEPPRRGTPVVSLIGSFAWQPTYTAAERLVTRLWPEISRRVPDARLQIVGRQAGRAVAALGAIPHGTIHEDVPEIAPYFQNTDVMLYAPLRGSGMKVKVMEAFAFGTPVVTTTDGIEGIPAEDGIHAEISDNDEELIERTVALLQDGERRQQRRLAARKLIREHSDPTRVLEILEGVYDACA